MKSLLIYSALLICSYQSYGQGCATIRNIIGLGQFQPITNSTSYTPWQLNVSNRYYKSFRDFRETTDLKTPAQNESVNRNFSTELTLLHLLPKGWSLSLSLPILANSRESSLEHGGPNTRRHTTHAFGLGDMRLMASKWLFTRQEKQNFNLQLSLGLKLPTGDFRVQDYFYRNDSTRVLAPVNPGIQLGDGGLGLITQLYAHYQIKHYLNLYADLYYMSSPRNQNGVSVLSGRTPTALQIRAGIPETSVTDAYVLRAGLFLDVLKNLSLTAGIRQEGVPVQDVIGASDGTRRPGYYLSAEPGLIYRLSKVIWYLQTPLNFKQSIKQNATDVIVTELTKTYTSSPGGSANVQILLGMLINL